MTKGELRKARQSAHAAGKPLTGELAIGKINPDNIPKVLKRATRVASKTEQHGRYLDCGPQNWDDR